MSYFLPSLTATIERRLLINYALDPSVAADMLPPGLRLQLVDGSAVAGVCLIRLGDMRVPWMPRALGWGAENAAHRIAVEWDDDEGTQQGVYIPVRHSASWLPVAVGGRLFPGVHRHARFTGSETANRIRVELSASDLRVSADVAVVSEWRSRLFATVDDASAFFRAGSTGWSPRRGSVELDGLTLETEQWKVEPGRLLNVESSFFDALPDGSARLDSVLVMRDVPIAWSVPPRSRQITREMPARSASISR
ncbi:Uncharacterized conserved protein (COG2071) [Agreia bicolorata]|uniref:Uncharacterized conserved protein (COG2071) n=1 Tax=Agreia bicolorata TaxID=110935 RepID=A0A1T4YI91_9MICO|nr:DUF2071 domain-containing protein [Agreia bicolorata]SKB01499.1 Uncharacterized conserved protein (COG2071) [Agreia bicolorata]